jgi:hypothetical protein
MHSTRCRYESCALIVIHRSPYNNAQIRAADAVNNGGRYHCVQCFVVVFANQSSAAGTQGCSLPCTPPTTTTIFYRSSACYVPQSWREVSSCAQRVNKFDMLSQSNDKFRSSANAVSAAPLDLNLSIGLSSFAEADIETAHVRFRRI